MSLSEDERSLRAAVCHNRKVLVDVVRMTRKLEARVKKGERPTTDALVAKINEWIAVSFPILDVLANKDADEFCELSEQRLQAWTAITALERELALR